MSYTAVFDFKRSVDEKVVQEDEIHGLMSTDPLFNDPPVPFAQFLTQIDAQRTAAANALNGGHLQTEILRQTTRTVQGTVRKYRAYVNEVADGNREIILRSGFTPSKDPTPVGDMPKVSVRWIRPGSSSGKVKVRFGRIYGRKFIEAEIRPSEDGSAWEKVLTTTSLIAQIEGLAPLRRYILRARAFGTSGYGNWSDEQQFIVI